MAGMAYKMILTSLVLCAMVSAYAVFYLWKFNSGLPEESRRTSAKRTSTSCHRVCTTKSCVVEASRLLESMDLTVGACDNFYKHLCGNYPLDVSTIDSPKLPTTGVRLALLKVNDRLRRLLEDTPIQEPDKLVTKRKRLYDSCQNYKLGANAAKVFLHWLKENILSSTSENNTYSDEELEHWMTQLHLTKQYSFFTLTVSQISAADIEMTAKIQGIEVPREELPPPTILFRVDDSSIFESCHEGGKQELLDYVAEHFRQLDVPQETIETTLTDVVAIDKKFESVTKDISEEESVATTLNCEESRESMWCRIFHSVKEKAGMDIPETDVKLESRGEFKKLEELLHTEQKCALANYLAVRFFVNSMRDIAQYNKTWRVPCKDYKPEISLSRISDSRYDCVFFLTNNIPLSVTQDYLRDFNYVDKNALMTSVFKNIKEEIYVFVNQSWIEEEPRDDVLTAIKGTAIHASLYIDLVMSYDLDSVFEDLEVSDDFVLNSISLRRYNQKYNLKNYPGEFIKPMRNTKNFDLNAQHGSLLRVGFGYFEDPFLGTDLPRALEYGKIGDILGHEMSHDISLGLIFRAEIEDPNDKRLEYKKCLTDMYSNFDIPYLNVKSNNPNTIVEDMADVMGIDLSMHAATNNHVFENGLSLPGLQMSQEQFVFASYGSQWCEMGDTRSSKIFLDDQHSAGYSRVTGVGQNLPQFAEVFHCPEGSYMKPSQICTMRL